MKNKEKYCIDAVVGKRAGELINAGVKGTLYVLFSEAGYCNVGKEEILMLYDSRYGGISFGIGFTDAGWLLHDANIEPGNKMIFNNEGLYVPHASWHLKFNRIEETMPPLFPLNNHLILRSFKLLTKIILESERGIAKDLWILWHYQNEEKTECINANKDINIYAKKAAYPVYKLLAACLDYDKQGICAAVNGLLGLGPGLTPSFDDWIIGFQYTLRFFSEHYGVLTNSALILGETLLSECSAKTSVISGAYLKTAAKNGEIFLLDNLLRLTIMPDGESKLKKAANRLLQVGANSGADMITGVIFAFEFYLKMYHNAKRDIIPL